MKNEDSDEDGTNRYQKKLPLCGMPTQRLVFECGGVINS